MAEMVIVFLCKNFATIIDFYNKTTCYKIGLKNYLYSIFIL